MTTAHLLLSANLGYTNGIIIIIIIIIVIIIILTVIVMFKVMVGPQMRQ